MRWETLLVAGSHFGLSPGWHSMRPSRKGLESEGADVSCWEATRPGPPLHRASGCTGPVLLRDHLEVPPCPHRAAVAEQAAGPEAKGSSHRLPATHIPSPDLPRGWELLCPEVAFNYIFQEKM